MHVGKLAQLVVGSTYDESRIRQFEAILRLVDLLQLAFAGLRGSEREIATFDPDIVADGMSLFEGIFQIVVVGIIVNFADIDHNKEFLEIVPKHEKGAILISIKSHPQLILHTDPLPEVVVVVIGSSLPLHISPGIPQLQDSVRLIINSQLNNI